MSFYEFLQASERKAAQKHTDFSNMWSKFTTSSDAEEAPPPQVM